MKLLRRKSQRSVHVCATRIGYQEKYCSILHRAEATYSVREVGAGSLDNLVQVVGLKEPNPEVKQPVLVHDIEVVEHVQGVRLDTRRPVWLKPREEIHRGRARALYFSDTAGFVFLPVPEHRKLRPGPRRTPAGTYQLPGQMIEGGAQVVHGIPDQDAEARRRIFGDAHSDRDTVRWRIVIHDRPIRVTCPIGSDFAVEVVEVLDSPFNLEPRPI